MMQNKSNRDDRDRSRGPDGDSPREQRAEAADANSEVTAAETPSTEDKEPKNEPATLFPAAQELPVFRRECADDRLQNVKLLQRFTSERGKIVPSRITAVSAKKQRELATAIKRARNLALMPFIIN